MIVFVTDKRDYTRKSRTEDHTVRLLGGSGLLVDSCVQIINNDYYEEYQKFLIGEEVNDRFVQAFCKDPETVVLHLCRNNLMLELLAEFALMKSKQVVVFKCEHTNNELVRRLVDAGVELRNDACGATQFFNWAYSLKARGAAA